MTQVKHTALPWYAYEPQKDTGEIVITRDCSHLDTRICKVLPVSPQDEDTTANAAFIVKACNNFDDLVDALECAIPILEEKQSKLSFTLVPLKEARAALAKARGDA